MAGIQWRPDLSFGGPLTPLEAELNREIAQFFRGEHLRLGDRLFEWYRDYFVANGIGLTHYDISIARFYLASCRDFARYVEVGAGAAQQSVLLAAQRIHATPVESDMKQVDLMHRLIDHIARRVDPELPRYIQPIDDWFPNNAASYVDAGAVLSFPGLAATMLPGAWERVFAALPMAGALFVNKSNFFRWRGTPAERQELIDRITRLGFAEPVAVCNWRFRSFVAGGIVYMRRVRGAGQ